MVPVDRHGVSSSGTTRVEHDAVRKMCEKLENRGYRVTWLEVDEEGSLDIDGLRAIAVT